MSMLKFKRFTKVSVLKQIKRSLLEEFLGKFELAGAGVVVPSKEMADEEFFEGLAGLLMGPEELPEAMNEALFAIDELANEGGRVRLAFAVLDAEVEGMDCPDDTTDAEYVLMAWLRAPELVARKHNEQRLRRLSSFEYFGTKLGRGERLPFVLPDPEKMDVLRSELDEWFSRNSRGERTTVIEKYFMFFEVWFVVRHGDTFVRTPAVNRERTEIMHFRPAKDDVIVYSPEHDEIRINAQTKGEKELYRAAFGCFLRGDAGYFSETKAYTLDPLQTHEEEALQVDGVAGIQKIVLREVEYAWENALNEVFVRKADDVFEAARSLSGECEPIPSNGKLLRASFDVYFHGSRKPRKVLVRPPNILRVGRQCDAVPVQEWLLRKGFKTTQPSETNDVIVAIA